MSVEKQEARTSSHRQVQTGTKRISKRPRGKVLTRDAGIFKIMGIGESKVADGFSWRKHELDR